MPVRPRVFISRCRPLFQHFPLHTAIGTLILIYQVLFSQVPYLSSDDDLHVIAQVHPSYALSRNTVSMNYRKHSPSTHSAVAT